MSLSQTERGIIPPDPPGTLPTPPHSSIDFTIGPEANAVQAVERATATVNMALPQFLAGTPDSSQTCHNVLAVLTELVDLTARYKAGRDLVGSVTWDGSHAMVSVGDMRCPLPAPEDEPGLYLVHGIAGQVSQYAGDMGGHVTWAAVAA